MKRLRSVAMVVVFIILSIFSDSALAQGRSSGGWEHGPGMMGWFGPFGMIIFWIIAIVVIVLVARGLMSWGRDTRIVKSEETALDVLKKRYASGEITKEVFEEMKKDIME
jgi:putative membrane protein